MKSNKIFYTLGLCTMGTSSAALFKDGYLSAAVEEERLTRKKNDNSFPNLAINEVLDIEGIELKDINLVAVYWQPWRIFKRSIGTLKKLLISSNSKKIMLNRVREIFMPPNLEKDGSWSDLFFMRKKLLNIDPSFKGKIKFFDHHLTHQKYGEAIYNWNNFFSLSYDGGGESHSTILTVVENGKKEIISKHSWPNSLGHFYSTFTGFLGFKMLEGEYKMMGLSPYGKPVFKEQILNKILKLSKNGKYKLNLDLCDYHSALKGEFNKELVKMFGNKRKVNELPTKTQINLASSVQAAFEDCLKHILEPALQRYPHIKKIVLTGGCALNVTANGKLLTSKTINEIIIPPAPHDAGCSIGACLCALKNNINFDRIRNPYLGREFSQSFIFNEIYKYCKKTPISLKEDDLIEKTVSSLIDGDLIAWFQGAAEFGPRALGARSFLADPRNDKIRDDINKKIKKRELFRPFAPSVIEESSQEIFDIVQKSPYMNIVAEVKSKDIPAVTHIDHTARVHTVSKDVNYKYHKLISRFGERTGIPVLLNTSFNIQEPIVYSPKDAIKTFINSEVDKLVIGDYFISREDLL